MHADITNEEAATDADALLIEAYAALLANPTPEAIELATARAAAVRDGNEDEVLRLDTEAIVLDAMSKL